MIGFLAIAILMQTPSEAPQPLAPVPSRRQLQWHRLETNAFIHFGINTFTNREWGDGKEDPVVFNPTQLDARQWVAALKAAGMRTIILTAKHHDGFCLWPTRQTKHSVASSPWRNGQGDVVGELAAACKEAGLRFGVYLSPWDRHEPKYGQGKAYNDFYIRQLTELLTNYGTISEVWFDGANGEGPNGKRQEYDWKRIRNTVRRLQPDAVMFSDAGPDIRWIGNESGVADETNWGTLFADKMVIGGRNEGQTQGHEGGPDWVPGECDVSIRPGWFYHSEEDDKVKTVDQLVDLYFKSVGRGASFLLNVPPDRRGLIHENDVKILAEFGRTIARMFRRNLARNSGATAGTTFGDPNLFGPSMVVDGKANTYWAAASANKSGWIEVDLGASQTFDCVEIKEPLRFGQRIKSFGITVWNGKQWVSVGKGTTVGSRRLIRFEPIEGSKVRLDIYDSRAHPLVQDLGVYLTRL